MNMFIIDFDDTLFDTQAFKHARMLAVEEFGVSEEIFWKTYQEARNSTGGVFTYSDKRHAHMLSLHGFDEGNVLSAFERISGEVLSNFLIPGAIKFLDFLKNFNTPMILLSLGDPLFQEIKVKGSGIHHYFDRTFMVDVSKKYVLGELLEDRRYENVWFINDKIQETIDLMIEFPDISVVLKKSPRFSAQEYKESDFIFFEHLIDIQAYIQAYDK